MLEKYHKKIAQSLAIIFAGLSVIVAIDYLIPREIYNSIIDDMTEDNAYHPRYSRKPSYTIEIGNQTIRADDDTYGKLNIGDTVEVQKTIILKKVTILRDYAMTENKIDIYVAPFTYFPLYPLLFILPLIFAFTKDDSMLLMISRSLSLGIAMVSLLMVLF